MAFGGNASKHTGTFITIMGKMPHGRAGTCASLFDHRQHGLCMPLLVDGWMCAGTVAAGKTLSPFVCEPDLGAG